MQFSIGRARPPLLREESVSSKRQLMAERSLIARAFSQTRSLGVALNYEADVFQIKTGFMDTNEGLFGDQSWRASTRLGLLLAGRWKALKDFTSFPDDEPTIALGAGILYEDQDRVDPADVDWTLLRWTVDVAMEMGGANLFAALVASHRAEEGQETLDQDGLVVQGGVFVTDKWELFAQYLWGDADGEAVDLRVVTIGVNRYVVYHRLKWTADVGLGLSEVGGFWSSTGAGWRRDRTGEDGQVVVRAQLQLLF